MYRKCWPEYPTYIPFLSNLNYVVIAAYAPIKAAFPHAYPSLYHAAHIVDLTAARANANKHQT